MKLRQRMLLVFAVTLAVGAAAAYWASQAIVLSSFRDLENEQMKRDVGFALSGMDLDFRNLAASAGDYAYWDHMCDFLQNPHTVNIASEFQDSEMEQLGFSLVVIRDTHGKTLFARAYDRDQHHDSVIPAQFLEQMFSQQALQPAAIALMPQDGMVEFPDGPYIVSTRPILTSRRTGHSRGVFFLARKFDDAEIDRLATLTRTDVTFEASDSTALPPDFLQARRALDREDVDVAIQPLSSQRIAGYTMISDIFHVPTLLMKVETPRPIHDRGELSQRYLFATVICGAVIFSLVILFFMQKLVLSRLAWLSREVSSIGERKAVAERVQVSGRDELSGLGQAINGMLRELQKSQEQVALIAENIEQVFWVRDTDSGAYDYVSGAFEKIWGRSREVLRAGPKATLELVDLEDRALAENAATKQSGGTTTDVQFRIGAPEGGVRWLWERTFPLFDETGQLKQTAGLTEDTTDFKRTEEALRTAQLQLEDRVARRTAELAERGELVKLLLDSTSSAMYGINSEGHCTFCNPAALHLLGYRDSAELLGRNIHELIHHTRADGSKYPEADCPVLGSLHHDREVQIIEETFWRKDGVSFPAEYSSRQIRRNGRVVGAVVTFLDTTDRKRREVELRHGQKLAAVGRLAAGIAHEINTPIQFVGDNARFLVTAFQDEMKLIEKYEELLLAAGEGRVNPTLSAEVSAIKGETDWPFLREEIPRAIEQMLEGLGRVVDIVRGMKEFSHVDRSNEKSPGDINRAIESTLIVVRNELKYVADIEVELGEIPPVMCQVGDLNQVFLNLLVNAAHAIGDVVKDTGAKGKIRVATRADGDWVEISIADSGSGIPEEVRGNIFDPFFTTKEVGKGTGQGLALAHAVVVDKHGGTLTYETEVGEGTTFRIRLPLSPPELAGTALLR
ncbi:MAG TPA: CHASE4 domain-containing protein [Candidatus Acidoferrales bacterium]